MLGLWGKSKGVRPRRPSMQERAAKGLVWVQANVVPLLPYFVIALLLTVALVQSVVRFAEVIDRPISVIEVSGTNEHFAAEQVEQILDDQIGVGFWGVDVAELRSRLLADEWLVNARVTKRWPGRLVVEVKVHEPLAYWNETELLSTQGSVFAPEPYPQKLPLAMLSGPDESQWSLWERYLSLQGALEQLNLGLAGLSLSERGALTLVLEDGMAVHLGRHEVESRLQRFLDVFEQTLAQRIDQVAAVDLRYTNGFSVRWVNEGAEEEQQ